MAMSRSWTNRGNKQVLPFLALYSARRARNFHTLRTNAPISAAVLRHNAFHASASLKAVHTDDVQQPDGDEEQNSTMHLADSAEESSWLSRRAWAVQAVGWLAGALITFIDGSVAAATTTAEPRSLGSASSTLAAAVVRVGPGQECSSVQQALTQVAEGGTVLIEPGVYRERLSLSQSVTLQAASVAPRVAQGDAVVLVWETESPYQAVVSVPPSTRVTLSGLVIKHRSPSVANNYAIFVQGGELLMDGCAVSSSSGAGVGLDGGSLQATSCSFSGNARHGVAAFGSTNSTDEPSARVLLQGCDIRHNKLNGVLAGPGVVLDLVSSSITNNKQFGVVAKDCELSLQSCVVQKNGGGSLQLGPGSALAAQRLSAANMISPSPSIA